MSHAELPQPQSTPIWLKRFLLVVFLLVPVVNFGVFLLPGGEQQFSDMPRTRVDAAGYAFSIWGLIFAAMIAFSFTIQKTAESSRALTYAIAGLIVAGMASILFVPASLYANQTIVWIDIAGHLTALIVALFYLRKHCNEVPGRHGWSFVGPSMYCGWISAATVISTALMLQELGVTISAEAATVVACTTLGAIATIACLMIWSRDQIFGATIAWALVAIGVEQSAYPPIRWTAWTAAALIVCLLIVVTINRRPFYPQDVA